MDTPIMSAPSKQYLWNCGQLIKILIKILKIPKKQSEDFHFVKHIYAEKLAALTWLRKR